MPGVRNTKSGVIQAGSSGIVKTIPAGPAIPSSVVLQYYATTWSQGDGTWVDDTGTVNMPLNGDFQDDTLSDGSSAINSDGNDDHGRIDLPSSLEGSSLEQFSFEFAIEYTNNNSDQAVTSIQNINNTQSFRVALDVDHNGNSSNGGMRVNLLDPDPNQLQFGISSGLDDGNRHDVSVIINDSTANDVEIIIDGSQASVSFDSKGSPSNFGSWDQSTATFAGVDFFGDIVLHADIKLGAMRWHDSAISEQTISNYP